MLQHTAQIDRAFSLILLDSRFWTQENKKMKSNGNAAAVDGRNQSSGT